MATATIVILTRYFNAEIHSHSSSSLITPLCLFAAAARSAISSAELLANGRGYSRRTFIYIITQPSTNIKELLARLQKADAT